MAISRVPGYSLISDLDRQGVDLQFTTNGTTLAYLDFANFRYGINTSSPSQALEVNGNIIVSNGHIYTSGNINYNIGNTSNWFNQIYANTIISGQVTGRLQTNAQPNITSVGNLTSLAVTGNIIAGNISSTYLTGNLLSILNVTGDATGSGLTSNIAITLVNTGVTAGIYGSADNEYADKVPRITVDSKGRITNIANISLTQIGNVSIINTTISTTSNLTIAPLNQTIFVGNSIISNVANPVNQQDAVTVSYLNSALTGLNANLKLDDSSINILDTGADGRIEITVDSILVGNINFDRTSFYNQVTIGGMTLFGDAISSEFDGNITLNAMGTGIVQVAGSDAFGLPYGTNLDRPTNPRIGYIRFNTSTSGLEVWDGLSWMNTVQTITSQLITPNGTGNTYPLTTSTTTAGVIVTINGTVQQPTTSYLVTGNLIVFSEIPLTSDIIEVRTLLSGAAEVITTKLEMGNTSISIDPITGNILTTVNNSNISILTSSGIVTGNINASGYIIGNGSLLTGLPASYSNANVSSYLPTYTGAFGNITGITSSGTIQTTGVVYGNANIASTSTTTGALRVTGGVGISGNINAGNVTATNLTGNVTATTLISNGSVLVGPSTSANLVRFPNALTVISNTPAGIQQNELGNIGIIGEAVGGGATRNAGVYGAGYTAGTYSCQGVVGEGHVSSSSDTAPSVGVRGYANDTHANGFNVGLYGDASGSSTGNYSLYLNNGNIFSNFALTWTLNGNLTFSGNTVLANALSISGNINAENVIATNLTGTILTASQTNITSVGNLTSLSASGTIQTTGVVWGNSGVGGTLLTAAQTNITSVGNLTSLSASGTIQTTGIVYGNSGISGTLLTAAQTNITSVGNLTALSAAGVIRTTGIVYANASIASTSTTTGALVVTGGAGISGNLHLPSTAQLHIGADLVALVFPNALVTLDSNVNTYQQVVMQNISNGTSASSDFVAVADTGTDSTNYVDVGINSSTYSDVNYTIGTGLDSYAYSNGGNFLFGTQTPGKSIIFHTSGTLSANLRGRFTDQGLTINTATATSSVSSGALVVNGGAGVSGDLRVGGNLYVGNLVTNSTTTLTVTAPILYLTTSAPYPYNYDIGFYSAFTGGTGNIYQHTGLVRSDNDGMWHLFSNVAEPMGGVVSFTNAIYDQFTAGGFFVKGDPATALINSGTSGIGNIGSPSAIWNTVYASKLQGTLTTSAQTDITSVGNLTSLSVTGVIQTTGIVYANSNIASTSTTTGALQVIGGVGVSGKISTGSITANTSIITTSNTAVSGLDIYTVSSNTAAQISLHATSGLVQRKSAIKFYGTFNNSADTGERYVTSIRSGFDSTSTAWGSEYLSVFVNNAVNDGATDANQTEIARFTNYDGLIVYKDITNGQTAGTGNIGASGAGFNTVFAKATSAQYADLAENYLADAKYEPGTVLEFGGEFEVTLAEIETPRLAGVVSTNPAYLMNEQLTGNNIVAIALQGRVPCKVKGVIKKGDMLTSCGDGHATTSMDPKFGTIIGKALQNFNGISGIIEVVVGRL